MAHEVIMPALGMAQDTGKLIAWLKRPGEAVAVGEVLFEVETDKSVAEVEAQQAGFLTDVRAADGDDVPVGQVIALISQTAEDSAPSADAADAEGAEAAGAPAAPAAPDDTTDTTDTAPAAPDAARAAAPDAEAAIPASAGRLLASPKARRLAAEEGLDLERLAQAGHPQPFHAADLAVLRALPAGRNSPPDETRADRGTDADPAAAAAIAATAGPPPSFCQIGAQVPRTGVTEFLDWMERDGGIVLSPAHLLVSLAARALRSTADAPDPAAGPEAALTVALLPLTGSPEVFADPDRCRLSALRPTEAAPGLTQPDLILRDLTASRLTGLRGAASDRPVVTVAVAGDDYVLTLDFDPARLSQDRAIALLTGLADRLDAPLLSVL